MTEAENNTEETNETEAQGNEQQFVIQKVYVKDVSFESPGVPQIFTKEWKPEINLDLNTTSNVLDTGLHNVMLTLTVTVKSGEETAFLVEVQQCGIFAVAGFTDEQMGHMLGSYCPNVLFPYAREAISDLVTKCGFPPLLLAPVNFDALYAQHIAQQQSGEAAKH
jgi:preprotein translocase subunit SecB